MAMMSLHLVLGPLAALAVLMVTTGLALAQGRNHLGRRLAAYTAAPIVVKRPQRVRVPLRDRLPNVFGLWQGAAAGIPLLNRRATRLERWLARQLVRASISITPRELVLIALGIVLGGMALGLLLWGTPAMAIATAAASLAGLAGYVRYKQRRRLRTFGEQLPEVLAMLIISLRAGFSVMQALDAIRKQIRAPAALEFATVIREI